MEGDIDSVSQLIEELENCQASDFVKVSKRLKLKAEDFQEFASWSKNSYTRNCISRSNNYELLLLCWDAKQDTPIHCHNGEECWVYNLQGNFEEIRFDFKEGSENELVEISRDSMQADEISYMHDNMGFHSLHNRSSHRGMTLHLYMNPIDTCRIYNEEKGRFIRKEMCYDTVANTIEV